MKISEICSCETTCSCTSSSSPPSSSASNSSDSKLTYESTSYMSSCKCMLEEESSGKSTAKGDGQTKIASDDVVKAVRNAVYADIVGGVRPQAMKEVYDVLTEIINNINTPSLVALHEIKPKIEVEDLPYFTPSEVVAHNKEDDIWVTYLQNVYNITPLMTQCNEEYTRPLLAFAGKDISHWFNYSTGNIQYYIHPVTGVYVPYCPHGHLLHVGINVPATSWKPLYMTPWWCDQRYKIGRLTQKARPIRILNTLTGMECTLTVCKEDTLLIIQQRLNIFNRHSNCYTWKYEGRVLDMTKTLDDNGIPDEREIYTCVHLPETLYIPAICVYFNDDLEWDEDEY